MSDTPKTDELAKRDFVPDGLWIRHARELERENAALREDKERMNFLQRVAEEGGFQCFGVEDSELLDFEFSNHGNQTSESVRAAIDAARKEAHP